MEKFLVTGHSKATESESCRQFRLSLPIAKHYEPHIVKKGEEQLYPLDIIYKAVYRKKYDPLHVKPRVEKSRKHACGTLRDFPGTLKSGNNA